MSDLLKRIIPCLDVKNGRCVKGINFQNLRDMGDPVELAVRYEEEGADEIVFLDIAATYESRPTALEMVRKVSQQLSIPFTLGGGLREIADIYAFLEAGADKVALNSAAVTNPGLIARAAKQFGSQCIVVAIDFKRESNGEWLVYSHGGHRKTDREALLWAKEVESLGAGELLLTSMDRDGTGTGFDLEITEKASHLLKVPIIASGGAETPHHLAETFRVGADAALAATMFHSGAYPIDATKKELHQIGLPVRFR